MRCIEIILEETEKKYLDEMIREVLKFNAEDIISSHFFDEERNKNIEFQDIENFNDFFGAAGTGNFFLKKTVIGIELEEVLIIISCDEKFADITINFGEEQFEKDKNLELKNKIRKLFLKLCEIQKKYCIRVISVGYEPAADDDMKIVEFRCGQTIMYNENGFLSQFAQSCYDILKHIKE